MRIKFKNELNHERQIVIFVPKDDVVNGGILSLVSLFNVLNNHYSPSYNVFFSTSNYKKANYFFRFSKFNNSAKVFSFKDFFRYANKYTHVRFFIPEMLIIPIIEVYQKEISHNNKVLLSNIKNFEISILNQNDLLMPSKNYLEILQNCFTKNISMGVAHKRYATMQKKAEYGMPLHYLSAWISSSPYKWVSYDKKRDLILLSPDNFDRAKLSTNRTKTELLDILKNHFPQYEIIVIKGLKYEEYRKIISEAKFMITLGEGVDAYFTETILSGGVSFAIYNNHFFTGDFQKLPTVFSDVEDMFKNLCEKINSIDNIMVYGSMNKLLYTTVESEYTFDKYKSRVINYFEHNYDFS